MDGMLNAPAELLFSVDPFCLVFSELGIREDVIAKDHHLSNNECLEGDLNRL